MAVSRFFAGGHVLLFLLLLALALLHTCLLMMLHYLYIAATSDGKFVSVFDNMTGGFIIQSQEFEKSSYLEVATWSIGGFPLSIIFMISLDFINLCLPTTSLMAPSSLLTAEDFSVRYNTVQYSTAGLRREQLYV